jgi:hypothetical protein
MPCLNPLGAGKRRSTTMKTILRYAAHAGLIGMFALAAASGPFGQVRIGAPAGNELTQYCAPQEESPDAHRFYCRSEA